MKSQQFPRRVSLTSSIVPIFELILYVDKVLASTNVAKLFFTVYKILCGDSDEAKQMRAEYYPKVKPGTTAKAKTSTEDAEVKAMIEEFVPALKMAYFTGKDANTYAYTTKREEIVFNRYICDAFEEALVKQREPQLSMLKYVILLTSYHELAHACFNGTESRTRLGTSATRRSSRTLQACPMHCVCRITRENLGGPSRELKYTARKYKEATGVHLVKYEKNVEKDYLDCKVFNIS